MEPLLSTKFYIPPTRSKIVTRPRLIERLNAGLDHKLTLISAPAGFGKTTLVSEWVEELRTDAADGNGTVARIAWLSLDAGDNDLTRFLIYTIAALQSAEAGLAQGTLQSLQSPQPPPAEAVLTRLINAVAPVPDPVILVFDDYQAIETPSVHHALTFLLEHLPPRLHLVLVSRVDPQLPLSRLRARDQLTELRATDLRFTATEAAAFLNQVMGLNLSSEDIAELETRTEGWIAGLQLAALSMRRHGDRAGFIKSFTGGHRLVLDFLMEEVLGQQSESIQNFLLQTSILDRMTGSLCDALTGQENGHQILEMLDRANLFIVPLDNERHWYRYHHLFADLLRQRLYHTQPQKTATLHSLACSWYEQQGLIDEAIEHALQSKNYERATQMINNHIEERWREGKLGRLMHWLEILPDEFINEKS